MEMIDHLHAANGCNMLVEQLSLGIERARRLDPMFWSARGSDADEAFADEERACASGGRLIAKARAHDAVDIALEHRRRRVEPERIDEGEDLDVLKPFALDDDVRAQLEIAGPRKLVGVQAGIESDPVEIAQHNHIAPGARGIPVGARHRHREAFLSGMRNNEGVFHGHPCGGRAQVSRGSTFRDIC